jgi:hypothetical protein
MASTLISIIGDMINREVSAESVVGEAFTTSRRSTYTFFF